MQVLETYPRDELFQISVDELFPIALAVVHLQERRQLRLFVREDIYGRYLSCLVYLPRDRFNTAVRERFQRILLNATGGHSIDHTALVSEALLARLHFVIRMAPDQVLPELDVPALEKQLAAATRAWSDDFSDTLAERVGEEQAARLVRRYRDAFPEAYKEDFPARTAVADLARLEELPEDNGLAMNLYQPVGAAPDERRFKIYRTGTPISLTQVLPILSRMGVEVIDERPYEVIRHGESVDAPAWIYDFGLRYQARQVADASGRKERFQEAFAAVWRDEAESDGFNALVLQAGLSWREASILRAYAKYLRQAGRPSARTTSKSACRLMSRSPSCSSTCSRPGSIPIVSSTTPRAGRPRRRRSSCGWSAPSTTSPASIRTASFAPSSPSCRRRCGPTTTG